MTEALPMTEAFAWTAATDQRLRTLWDLGTSTKQIGVEMGITKNAAVGRAHRLNLPARKSPIPVRDMSEEQMQALTAARERKASAAAEPSAPPPAEPPAAVQLAAVVPIAAATASLNPDWSPEELALLRGPHSLEELAALTGRPIGGVLAKKRGLGLLARPVLEQEAHVIATQQAPAVRVLPAPPPPVAAAPAEVFPFHRSCQWPIGQEGRRHVFCCEPVTRAGRSYCAKHLALAFQPIPRRTASAYA